jgi:cytochrome c-type biogenesis protein CcmF
MPWLAATAFLHSVMVQEKKGMMKVWNMLLVVMAFCLSLFGTFLTRSGIINSIHSFTQSSIGPWFLGFICLITVASLALIWYRLPLLRAKTKLESIVSREATFLYNNLLLVALCLTILWGVCYPLLTEAVRGQSVTVGRPYYDFFLRVFGLPLLLLMGIGPLIAWRRASWSSVKRVLALPALVAVLTGGILIAFGAGSSLPGLFAYSFSAFVLTSIAIEFVRGTSARRAVAGGGYGSAFLELVARNRRRYGGYVVHAAIVFLAIGIAGSSAYQSTYETGTKALMPGDSVKVAGYTYVFRQVTVRNVGNHRETRAIFDRYQGKTYLGRQQPGQDYYFREQQANSEMSISSNWLTAEDSDMILGGITKQGGVYVKVLVKPLINFIWLAGLIFVVGCLITLWPDAREERRLAERYGEVGAVARA